MGKIKSESMFSIFLRRMVKRKEAMFGLSILIILAVLAILAPYICRYNYAEIIYVFLTIFLYLLKCP